MKKFLSLIGVATSLSACSTIPDSNTGSSAPERADIGIRYVSEGNILGPYNHRSPVDPKNWRQLNEEQAPKKKGGMSHDKNK